MQRSSPRLQRGLQEVRRIHRAARRRAGADDGVDLVDEQHRVGLLLELRQHGLQPLLEVAAIARAGQQRAHVERVDHRLLQHLGHLALDDLARQALGDRRLADAGLADIERVVLGAAAQHLDGALDLVLAADQRIDAALAGLLVEVDAIGGQRLVALLGAALAAILLLRALDPAGARATGHLGLAVADVVDGVEPRHALVLEERHGMAVAFREQRHQHVGACDFLATRRLHVHRGALDDALEARGRQGSLGFWVMMPFRRLSMKVSRSWRRRSISTPQALRTGTASSSSVIARSRCSSVAYSWRRSPASPKARWRDLSRFLDSMDIELPRLKEQRTTLDQVHSFSNVHWRGCWFLRA